VTIKPEAETKKKGSDKESVICKKFSAVTFRPKKVSRPEQLEVNLPRIKNPIKCSFRWRVSVLQRLFYTRPARAGSARSGCTGDGRSMLLDDARTGKLRR
jgi:hypothetical protein